MLLQSLAAVAPGDNASHSSHRLFAVVYQELRKLAEDRLRRESSGNTLQPTALVHEVFLRLVSPNLHQQWHNTGHFFSAAAQAMRRILIDNARRKLAIKRGGNRIRINLQMEQQESSDLNDEQLMDLNDALTELGRVDPTKAQLVELKFFAGLSLEEIGEILGISKATAHRHWNHARAWLYMKISQPENWTAEQNQEHPGWNTPC